MVCLLHVSQEEDANMAMKAEKGSGQTSRNYRKGMKDALKSNQYKPTSQKKGQYKTISAKLAKKAKSGDKYSAGAGAAFSMLRQEKSMSNRGGGGTASAMIGNKKRTVTKKASASRNFDRMTGGKSSATKVTSTKKVTQGAKANKEIGKGIVGVIKANKNKPVAQKVKNSKYRKLDSMLRNQKASAGKQGKYSAERKAEGGLRGLSILRQDAAMARRGKKK